MVMMREDNEQNSRKQGRFCKKVKKKYKVVRVFCLTVKILKILK